MKFIETIFYLQIFICMVFSLFESRFVGIAIETILLYIRIHMYIGYLVILVTTLRYR